MSHRTCLIKSVLIFAGLYAMVSGDQPVNKAQPGIPGIAPAETAVRSATDLLERWERVEDPDNIPALVEELRAHLETIHTAAPDSPWLPYLLGRIYALTGRQGEAVTQLRKFVETREGRNEWRAHRLLGDLFVAEFPQLARASYAKAAELRANEPSVLLGLSQCAFKLGHLDEATGLARTAVQSESTPKAHAHLARMLLAQKKLEDALREATLGVELAKAAVGDRPGVASLVQELDTELRLLIDILQARINEPGSRAADYLDLAELIGERAENARLLSLYDRVRVLAIGVKTMSPSTPARLIEEYARALEAVGRKDQAIAEFERLLAMEPTSTAAGDGLNRLLARDRAGQ